jgi:hypothetical protein
MRLDEPKVEKFRPLGANEVIIQASIYSFVLPIEKHKANRVSIF